MKASFPTLKVGKEAFTTLGSQGFPGSALTRVTTGPITPER